MILQCTKATVTHTSYVMDLKFCVRRISEISSKMHDMKRGETKPFAMNRNTSFNRLAEECIPKTEIVCNRCRTQALYGKDALGFDRPEKVKKYRDRVKKEIELSHSISSTSMYLLRNEPVSLVQLQP